MSLVLSIYSTKGFREVTLPERSQQDLEILLQKDIFSLDQDVSILLRYEDGDWILSSRNAVLSGQDGSETSTRIQDGSQIELHTPQDSTVTVICFVQDNPFTVYRKYALAGLQQIRIGRGPRNDIIYQNSFVSTDHCVITFQDGKATLRDTSRNGTFVNFRRVYGTTLLKYGDSIRIMRLNIIYLGNLIALDDCDNLTVSFPELDAAGIARHASSGDPTRGRRILYHRSPRNLRKLNTEPFEIEAPPNPPDNREPPLLMSVGPALTMAIPMVLGTAVSAIASQSSGGASGAFLYMGLITAVASALIGSIWAVVNMRYSAKTRKQDENRRFERYSEYLIRMRDKVEQAYNDNAEALKERYLSAADCCILNESSPLLWNRNDSYEDFLSVRVGMGDIPFQAPIVVPKERFTLINDSLADKPKVIRDNFSTLHDVPVTVNLLERRLIGISGDGDRKAAIALAKAMIAQISTSNCYTEVKIAVVYDIRNDMEHDAWNFALWLPHVWSSDKKIRYIATNRTEMGDVFYALTQTLRNRSEEQYAEKRNLKPRFVLFVSDPHLLDGEAISRYVFDRDQDLGLSTVLLADRQDLLPNDCECILENTSDFQGLYDTRDGRAEGTKVRFDTVSDEALWNLSRNLGRIEVVESDQEGEIPNSLTFFDMYGIERPEQLEAPERWKRSDSISSMKALVGFRNGNTPCYLDIHERYHGPHGLVAGTTGSGKSETLQTYILSLAVNFSPEDIGFFIIDYKGGGMANLFDNLPHMIGSISNLSGNQVKRAMVSIQSENRRRQRIFTEYGVNNINGYTALYKSGDAAEPVPHLFIIIDEFAELKREEPEFMKELISVAQVGRSLGVHLILSTQRPSGTVDENIWANSKFRLCLRVQDRQDSMDMLHRTEAAYLTQAGRCYLQVGNDEIFELFQSGWSGATYDEELGGSSLLIAQMLSATGKVDLAGNHAKVKRKEELKRRWCLELIRILRETEEETGVAVCGSGFSFENTRDFREAFYRRMHTIQPDFEDNQFNTSRITDFCTLYTEEAPEKKDDRELADIIVRRASREGKRLPEGKTHTQLEVTVDYLKEVATRLGVEKIRKLWLPVLPNYLYLEDMEAYRRIAFDGTRWREKPRRFQLSAVIGMVDDPENQAQMPISLDFTSGGHHMVIGTVSTGKSTLLQSAIFSLVSCYTPDLLNIYCLDFSAKMLSVYADLKHVGGYLDEGDLDTDRISKFFTLITRILDERKTRFAGTSFEDYVNHEGWTIPAVLIVIDNYGSFHEKTGELYDSIMTRIAKEGNGYGIYLLVSAGGISLQEMPSRLAETFRTGVALEMPDIYAYSDVLRVVRPPVLPETKVKGRGLIYCGDRILEFQTALGAKAEGSPERNDLIKEAVQVMNQAWTGPRARAIPTIPAHPNRADFTSLADYADAVQNPALMPIGYDAEYATVYSFDLLRSFAWIVSGTKESGKTVLMENIMLTALERGDEILILEPGGSAQYESIALANGLKRYTDGQGILDCMAYLNRELVDRSPLKRECLLAKKSDTELFQAALANRRINLFIGNMLGLMRELNDPHSPAVNGLAMFDTICERGKGFNLFLYAEINDRDIPDLLGYSCMDSLRSYRAGIRFGGRFNDQKLLSYENINFQDQDRSMKAGIGVISSDNRDSRLEKVVIPMS